MIEEILPGLGTGYLIVEWLIRLVMLVVVPMRRDAAATRGWLLLIFFLPVVGLLLYLAIGRPRFPAWRIARMQALAPMLEALSHRLTEAAGPAGEAGAGIRLANKLGALPVVTGNGIELLDDYRGTIDRLIADIDGAQHHVRLLVYIFADDATGQAVIAALGRAVARGVACHVLLDPVGSHHWAKGTIARLRAVGVETRQALPFRWLRGRTRRDMRNHRKLFLIDGQIGYAGSQNIVDPSFKPGITNHELVLRITGPVVAEMAAIFLVDWYLETEVLLEPAPAIPSTEGAAIAQILPSGADYPLEGFATLLVWHVHAAHRSVVITTPYLIPDEGLIGAMRTAVLRGVNVDVIVSAVADQPLVSLAQRSYYDELLGAGVRIHRYRGALLHAKNVAIDGELAIVGSSNVDIRSFQLNEEVSVLLHDRESIAKLETIQRAYVTGSDPLDRATWRRRPWLSRIAENIARMVSPLL